MFSTAEQLLLQVLLQVGKSFWTELYKKKFPLDA